MDFRRVREDSLDRAVRWMAQLYGHESLDWDEARARAATRWLVANPDSGGVWFIETDGVEAGYLVLTVCVSLEFGGLFGLLDELYIDDTYRGRGVGPQAIAFAADWARARGFSALRLEVGEENARGQHVYRKAGFRTHLERRLMTMWL